jgi:hypothetical protein
MNGKVQRIKVTLDPEDLEIIHILSEKQKVSISFLIKKMVHEWLEGYEDIKLIQKIEEREKQHNPLISHKEFWDNSK